MFRGQKWYCLGLACHTCMQLVTVNIIYIVGQCKSCTQDCGLDYGLRFGLVFGLNFGLLSNKTGHKSVKDEVICAKAGLWTWIMLVDNVN